jgi:hypothetical protein
MVTRRLCAFRFPTGEPCHSPPLHDGDFCLMHSPEHAKEVQEARRLGGLRRKREVTIAGAYNLEPLDTIDGIRRLIDLVVLDTVGMENGIARNRLLAYSAMVALRALELREIKQRLMILEQSVSPNSAQLALPIFDVEQELLKPDDKEQHDSQQTTG